MYFLIISGMSGAGKSRAVATLEDLGYYCVDNLPIALIPRFAEVCLAATERYERVALVTDVRAGGDFQQLFDSLDSIRDMGCDYRILFLDTDTATLIRRYKETRRRHPLMDKGVSMTGGDRKGAHDAVRAAQPRGFRGRYHGPVRRRSARASARPVLHRDRRSL